MNERDLKEFKEFEEQFKDMCESGEFYDDITQSDVEWLVQLINKIK